MSSRYLARAGRRGGLRANWWPNVLLEGSVDSLRGSDRGGHAGRSIVEQTSHVDGGWVETESYCARRLLRNRHKYFLRLFP
jgi:hypothetical protein